MLLLGLVLVVVLVLLVLDGGQRPRVRRDGVWAVVVHGRVRRGDDTLPGHDETGTDAERPHRPRPHRGS